MSGGFWGRLLQGPWAADPEAYFWIAVMGFLVSASCGLVGAVLLVRRMGLVGDAIAHSVLPGLVAAFLLTGSMAGWTMFAGALLSGLAATGFVQLLRQLSPIKQDAAIGITFSSLFALGVVLVALFADDLHLDTDAVLFGELLFVPLAERMTVSGIDLGPMPVVRMAILGVLSVVLACVFWRHWLLGSFDEVLARTTGHRPTVVHYCLLGWTSLVVVGAFEAVGAITVVAMLVLPGATGLLLANRIQGVLAVATAHAAVSTGIGLHLSWGANASTAASIVLAGFGLFLGAWAVRKFGQGQ